MPVHDWKRVPSGLFHHFHQQWIAELCARFNARGLPRGYYAMIEQSASGVVPDILTLEHSKAGSGDDEHEALGLAVATAPPQTRFVMSAENELYAARANHIAILRPLGDVVAVLEIVSPGDKDSRHALRSFVEKSLEFLQRGIHLLVVDLLPPTPRDPQGIHGAIWQEIRDEPFALPPDDPLKLASYSAGPVKTAYVEPVAVGDELPAMPLFLGLSRHIPVPLEETYAHTVSLCPEPMREMLQPAG
ncbi:MAG: DUF4058 family protein [Planctomycetaceae bacterium]|nr:DUF4058 family protein [Planctomycetaceae bacterium]